MGGHLFPGNVGDVILASMAKYPYLSAKGNLCAILQQSRQAGFHPCFFKYTTIPKKCKGKNTMSQVLVRRSEKTLQSQSPKTKNAPG